MQFATFHIDLNPYCLTLASPASAFGAVCAPAQGVTDVIVWCKRLLGALHIIFDLASIASL
jgi:hypothetical protein